MRPSVGFYRVSEGGAQSSTTDLFGAGTDGPLAGRKPILHDGVASHDGSLRYDGSARYGGSQYGSVPLSEATTGIPVLRSADDGKIWLDGGVSRPYLLAQFGETLAFELLTDISRSLPGLWELKPPEPEPLAHPENANENQKVLLETLDALAADLRKLQSARGGRLDNNPPEPIADDENVPAELVVLTEKEIDTVLRATADTRLAVSTGDFNLALSLWNSAAPIRRKIADEIGTQLRNFATKFTDGLAPLAVTACAAYLSYELGVIDKSTAVGVWLLVLNSSK